MSTGIPQPAACNESCPTTENNNIPGPKGDTGEPGADGSNGVSAFSITTDGFTMPAVNGTVTVDVSNSSWMVPTQVVWVQNAGYMEVQATPTNTTVTLKNLGYTGNTAPGGAVASLNKVSPAGLQGEAGADATASYVDGSATLDFPAVAANGGVQDLTIPVVGAAVDDPVSWSSPAALNAGLVPTAFVTAVDVVTYRMTNTTAAPIDPASFLAKVRVHK